MPAKQQTSSSKQPHLAPIPQGLQDQLDQFRKQLWRSKIAEALLAGCAGLLVSFLFVFTLDRFIETPTSVRLIILLSGTSLFTVFAPYWIHRWVYGHRRENQLARLISHRFPKLGDRLLGAVELQDQNEGKETLSPQLRAAAMKTVAADASKVDLATALPTPRHRKFLLGVITLLGISLGLLVTFPDAGMNSLKRWLMPLADSDRFTFTRLDLSAIGTPERIPYGEAFSLKIPLAKDSAYRPETARARYGKGDWIEASLKDGAYTFDFPGQRAQDTVSIEAHDAQHALAFEPVMRPEVERVDALVELPEYLQRPDKNIDLRSGYITPVEGSSMVIETTITRKLMTASAELVGLPKEIENYPTPESETDQADTSQEQKRPPESIKLKIDGKKLTTKSIPITLEPLMLTIHWKDGYKLRPTNPFQIRIEPMEDQMPSSYIQGVEQQHVMLVEETLQFDVIAEDDFGLKACGISWQGIVNNTVPGEPADGELTITQGGPTRTNINSPFSFSPANLSIGPQKITLRAWSEDYKPGRGRIYSEPVVIYILSRSEHAQVLKNQFDSAIGELEDIARKEQNLNDENLRTERNMGKDLQNEASIKKLRAQQDAEAGNKERMQALTERMEKLFKDAVRNGEIENEALKKMASSLQTMKELSQEDMPQIEKKLGDAQDKRNTNEKSQQDLKEAIEKQNAAIKKMQEALKDAKEGNKMFEAGTFVNRLKRAARTQDAIAENIIGIIDQIIGQEYDQLDPVEQRSVKNSHARQRQNAAELHWIQEDLSSYYSRTQKPEHKELFETIRESMIDQELENLSKHIMANLSFSAIDQSKYWSDEIRKWVEKLEGSKNSGGGGGGGGGGQSQQDQDFEFMLKVMRMIQKEQGIRARTRALEDVRRSLQNQSSEQNP